jgi:hypothetical protein
VTPDNSTFIADPSSRVNVASNGWLERPAAR